MSRLRRFDPLAERPFKGISFDVLGAAGVVVEPRLVRVPYCEPDGNFRFFKCFDPAGRSWYEPRPTEVGGLIPMGLETLPAREVAEAVVFITEGESDALAAREAFSQWGLFPGGRVRRRVARSRVVAARVAPVLRRVRVGLRSTRRRRRG